jgi:hypothetical protein
MPAPSASAWATLGSRITEVNEQSAGDPRSQLEVWGQFEAYLNRELVRNRTPEFLTQAMGIPVIAGYGGQLIPEALTHQIDYPLEAFVPPSSRLSSFQCADCDAVAIHDGYMHAALLEDGDEGMICDDCRNRSRYSYSERVDLYVHVDQWDSDIHEEESSDDDDEEEPEDYVPDRDLAPVIEDPETQDLLPLPPPRGAGYRDADGRIYFRNADGQVLRRGSYIPGSHRQTRLYQYSANPMSQLPGFRLGPKESRPRTRRPFFMGVELEVAAKNGDSYSTTVQAVTEDIGDFAMCKSDGSVSDCGGFEIVSVPGTLAFHRHAWQQFFENSAKRLHAWTVKDCSLGLHIHIDKVALGRLGAGKLMVFLHSSDNRNFVQDIAGRTRSSYAVFWGSTGVTSGALPSRGHYDAAGPSEKGTIEVRIFRANVAKRGFFRSLEFTDALCNFVQIAGVKELTVEQFMLWFQDPSVRANYPHFEAWLLGKGYIKGGKRQVPEPEYA